MPSIPINEPQIERDKRMMAGFSPVIFPMILGTRNSEYAEAERMIENRKGYVYSAYLKALEYKENKGGN